VVDYRYRGGGQRKKTNKTQEKAGKLKCNVSVKDDILYMPINRFIEK
jgi:hypothetical protein